MKRALKVKQKAFFIIFKGLSVTKNCLSPESTPLKKMEVITLSSLNKVYPFCFKCFMRDGISIGRHDCFYLSSGLGF